MIAEGSTLAARIGEFIRWERRKSRERSLLEAACYSLAAAFLLLPLNGLLRPWLNPAAVPLVLFAGLAPALLFFRRRFERPERALRRLDGALRLEERALTSWEILPQANPAATELLVLKQAGERLRGLEPRAVFPREKGWETYAVAPLLLAWAAFLWLGGGDKPDSGMLRPRTPAPAAQRLREFARNLEELAKSEGLRESLNLARQLGKTAEQRLQGVTAEERFREEVAAAAKNIESLTGGEKTLSEGSPSREALHELQTELQVAKESLGPAHSDGRVPGGEFEERLSALPRLKKAIEQRFGNSAGAGEQELRSFLDKLERETNATMDRHALLDAQQFLERMLREGRGQTGEDQPRVASGEKPLASGDGEKQEAQGSLAGTEPGKKEGGPERPPEPRAGAATHLKGLLGEGGSSGLGFKGKPGPGKAALKEEEIVAAYRRRAEAELNSEPVPDALKETIRNYFLSLGMGEGR